MDIKRYSSGWVDDYYVEGLYCGLREEKDGLLVSYEDHVEIVNRLVEALKFYAAGFTPVPGTFGLEWKPTEKLLEDCGNIAVDVISELRD